MKTTLISKDNNEAKLKMEFTAEEFDAATDKVYRKNRKDFQIPGFRKGKAPRKIIEAHYGEGLFFEDAVNELFGVNYSKAIADNDLDVIENPKVDFGEIGQGKPLTMDITVALSPVVEVKKYKGLKIDQVKETVTDKEVDAEIESLRKRNSRNVVVEREAKDGDTVNFDYSGFIGEEQFEGGTAQKQDLKIGSGAFIPGFEDQIKGKKAGDEFDVNVTFPEDYGVEKLAGKDAVFHCKLHEVREEQLPDVDDDFAADVSEYDTLDELKQHTKEDLQKKKDDQHEADAKNDLIDLLYKENEFDIPEAMVEDEITNGVNDLDQQLKYQGMSIDMYLKYLGKDMDALRTEMKEDAREKVAKRIILKSIASAENIEVSDDELEAELQRLADQYGMDVSKVKENIGEANMGIVKGDIRLKKAMDLVYDNAKVKFVKPPKKDEKKEEKAAEAAADKAVEEAMPEEPAEKAAPEAPAEKAEEPKEEASEAHKRRGGKGAGTR
ncbi:MAG: trigger factor [Eubacterium sp.]|nr:trigger factor [Eubacterium sp.]